MRSKFNLKRKLSWLFFTTTILQCIVSCKHKTDFDKLTSVRYRTDIVPIITSNCTFSGCHENGGSKHHDDEFGLSTYTDLLQAGIEPGYPEKSELYATLVSLNDDIVMPRKPYNRLSEKQIQLIYVWIGQGAKNN